MTSSSAINQADPAPYWELLKRDRYYLDRAANVTSLERAMVEGALANGTLIYESMIHDGPRVFCPVWRIRLRRLGPEAENIVRQMIWGLDVDQEPKP